jgi:hypothetical protein
MRKPRRFEPRESCPYVNIETTITLALECSPPEPVDVSFPWRFRLIVRKHVLNKIDPDGPIDLDSAAKAIA